MKVTFVSIVVSLLGSFVEYTRPPVLKGLSEKSMAYFASSIKATTPAASGAEADVPLNSSVHPWYKSVVT